MNDAEAVYIRYRNHRGTVSWRHIIPVELVFYATKWHGEPQWILRALDLDKDADRDFAMRDILAWQTTPPVPTQDTITVAGKTWRRTKVDAPDEGKEAGQP